MEKMKIYYEMDFEFNLRYNITIIDKDVLYMIIILHTIFVYIKIKTKQGNC